MHGSPKETQRERDVKQAGERPDRSVKEAENKDAAKRPRLLGGIGQKESHQASSRHFDQLKFSDQNRVVRCS